MAENDVSMNHLLFAYAKSWTTFFGADPDAEVTVLESDLKMIANITDKVFLVDGLSPYIIHVEPQSYFDPDLDRRMYMYNAALTYRYGLPVYSIALMLGRKSWRLKRNRGRYVCRSPIGAYRVNFRYDVIKIWTIDPALILQNSVGLLPLAPITNVAREELPNVIQKMRERFDHEVSPTEAGELWTATNALMGVEYDAAFAKTVLQGVLKDMKGSTTYQAILSEGEQIGLQKGRQEGSLGALRKALLASGIDRFGSADDAVVEMINGIEDDDKLTELVVRTSKVTSWSDLFVH